MPGRQQRLGGRPSAPRTRSSSCPAKFCGIIGHHPTTVNNSGNTNPEVLQADTTTAPTTDQAPITSSILPWRVRLCVTTREQCTQLEQDQHVRTSSITSRPSSPFSFFTTREQHHTNTTTPVPMFAAVRDWLTQKTTTTTTTTTTITADGINSGASSPITATTTSATVSRVGTTVFEVEETVEEREVMGETSSPPVARSTTMQTTSIAAVAVPETGATKEVTTTTTTVSTGPEWGLKEIYIPPEGVDATLDVVLVHGLGGHPIGTWTSHANATFWPRDLLPTELPNARILSYGYDSTPAKFMSPASSNMVHHHSITLVTELHYYRERDSSHTRPIVFICHSLGGIVVKRALIYSEAYRSGNNEHLRSVWLSTYGVVFMGTPHAGSDLAAWGKMVEGVVRTVISKGVVDTNSGLVGALGRNNEVLQLITDQFVGLQGALQLFFFWEELPTKLGLGKAETIVDYSSAVPAALPNAGKYGIHANHSEMCKFESKDAHGWRVLAGVLQRFEREAKRKIDLRWGKENWSKQQEEEMEIREKIEKLQQQRRTPSPSGHDVIPTPPSLQTPPGAMTPRQIASVPYEVEEPEERGLQQRLIAGPEKWSVPMYKPKTLAENVYTIGREKELEQLDQMMKRRGVVTIGAGTGRGKTHLARQYFFKFREQFPAGVFWLDCKSLRGAGEFETDVLDQQFTEFAELLQLPPHLDLPDEPYYDSEEAVRRKVIGWFERNGGWLLVFDGVDVLKDEEIENVAAYVPTVASMGSIIFTTVNNSLAGAARLGAPELLRLPALGTEKCVDMLFHYAQIPAPHSDHEKKSAEDLMKELDYIPLMIHSAGSYIKSKGMSVGTYLREYKKRPFVNQEILDVKPFHVIFQRIEESYREAHNLLRILCFFDQQIPIEMLLWGIKALQPRSLVQDFIAQEGGRRDFNATIAHLLAHSLIERSAQESPEDPIQIEMLRVHSVAQHVAISRMRSESRTILRNNLATAIKIFCNSFAALDARRQSQPGVEFLVSDYKRYLVHGHRLRAHNKRHNHDEKNQRFEETMERVQKLAEVKDDAPVEDGEDRRISMFRVNSLTDSSSLETPTPRSPRGTTSWPWQGPDENYYTHSPENNHPGNIDFQFQQRPMSGDNTPRPGMQRRDEMISPPNSPPDPRKDRIKRETLRKFQDNVEKMRNEKPFKLRYTPAEHPPSATPLIGTPNPPVRKAYTIEHRKPYSPAATHVTIEDAVGSPRSGTPTMNFESEKQKLKKYLLRSVSPLAVSELNGKRASIVSNPNPMISSLFTDLHPPPPSPPILSTGRYQPGSPGPSYTPLYPATSPIHVETSGRERLFPPGMQRERSGSLPNMVLMPGVVEPVASPHLQSRGYAYTRHSPLTMPPYPLSPGPSSFSQPNPFETLPDQPRGRPFTPGFIPPSNISSSPVARSIVSPRGVYVESGLYGTSEPIIDHSNYPSPRSSSRAGRGRSSSSGGTGRGRSRTPVTRGFYTSEAHVVRSSQSSPGAGTRLGARPAAMVGQVGASPLRRSSVAQSPPTVGLGLGLEGLTGGEAMGRSRSAPGQGQGVGRVGLTGMEAVPRSLAGMGGIGIVDGMGEMMGWDGDEGEGVGVGMESLESSVATLRPERGKVTGGGMPGGFEVD